MKSDLNQLLTPTEAAALKGWGLNSFKYRIAKPDAPQPQIIGRGHVFYNEAEILAWQPATQPKGRKKQ